MDCPHYEGLPTKIRHPKPGERFKAQWERVAVCECGVCLGYIARGSLDYNPILSQSQRVSVSRFLIA